MGFTPLEQDLQEIDRHFNLSEPLPSFLPNSVLTVCRQWCRQNCVQITIQNARTIYTRLRTYVNNNI